MKKLSLALAVAATLGAGMANAYTVAVPDDGVLVPNVIHNGSDDTTAVALINHGPTGVIVYWTFFDPDSDHITDGNFPLTPDDMYTFIWSEESGLGLEGERGYLVFMVGDSAGNLSTDAELISAAAFQADAANGDAVYIPTFPIDDADIVDLNLTTLDADSLATLASGAPAGDTVDMRYVMDGEFASRILLWSTGGLAGSFTVNMYNDEQDRKSVNFPCPDDELCFIDPMSIVGRPADFTNGFIRLNTSLEANSSIGDFVSYTAVRSNSFRAVQTILNTHYTAANG